jgi:diadenosine tetraphosphate (Ap4A) HIT family hydrolase
MANAIDGDDNRIFGPYERFEVDWATYHRRARTGPCFICRIVARHGEFPAHIVYEDDTAIAFLDKYPRVVGYTLVAPKAHREQVTGSFSLTEYLELQRVVHTVAEAVREEVGAARTYLLSLGSNEGNAHVHWHIVPMPSGVPYAEQQLAIFNRGPLSIPERDCSDLAARLATRISASKAFGACR